MSDSPKVPDVSHERHKIKEHEVQGFKYFKAIAPLLESLRHVGCERDRAGNRLRRVSGTYPGFGFVFRSTGGGTVCGSCGL